ncbi:MAG: hypothetical protein WDW36_001893 [Sanguina aurantia]
MADPGSDSAATAPGPAQGDDGSGMRMEVHMLAVRDAYGFDAATQHGPPPASHPADEAGPVSGQPPSMGSGSSAAGPAIAALSLACSSGLLWELQLALSVLENATFTNRPNGDALLRLQLQPLAQAATPPHPSQAHPAAQQPHLASSLPAPDICQTDSRSALPRAVSAPETRGQQPLICPASQTAITQPPSGTALHPAAGSSGQADASVSLLASHTSPSAAPSLIGPSLSAPPLLHSSQHPSMPTSEISPAQAQPITPSLPVPRNNTMVSLLVQLLQATAPHVRQHTPVRSVTQMCVALLMNLTHQHEDEEADGVQQLAHTGGLQAVAGLVRECCCGSSSSSSSSVSPDPSEPVGLLQASAAEPPAPPPRQVADRQTLLGSLELISVCLGLLINAASRAPHVRSQLCGGDLGNGITPKPAPPGQHKLDTPVDAPVASSVDKASGTAARPEASPCAVSLIPLLASIVNVMEAPCQKLQQPGVALPSPAGTSSQPSPVRRADPLHQRQVEDAMLASLVEGGCISQPTAAATPGLTHPPLSTDAALPASHPPPPADVAAAAAAATAIAAGQPSSDQPLAVAGTAPIVIDGSPDDSTPWSKRGGSQGAAGARGHEMTAEELADEGAEHKDQAEASIVAVYAAMLLGFLIADDEARLVEACAVLSGGTVRLVVTVVERALLFYNSAGAITESSSQLMMAMLGKLKLVEGGSQMDELD